jgi:putative ABC transport system ATP-binding protein
VSSSQPSPVVEARNLQFAFGEAELRKQILFDIQLTIRMGEIILLTGPSGSGKTTLLTLIGGLRRVQQGELFVLGQAMHQAHGDALVQVRRELGFIFQQHNLLDFLTAQQNVELMYQLHPEIPRRETADRAAAILTSVGLGHRLSYHPSQLSGGQRQRVAIARALASNPRLLLADEPTAALDSQSGREVVELLRRLASDQHCPVLMVTHDNRVLDIADRIIAMEDGRITNPSHPQEPAR